MVENEPKATLSRQIKADKSEVEVKPFSYCTYCNSYYPDHSKLQRHIDNVTRMRGAIMRHYDNAQKGTLEDQIKTYSTEKADVPRVFDQPKKSKSWITWSSVRQPFLTILLIVVVASLFSRVTAEEMGTCEEDVCVNTVYPFKYTSEQMMDMLKIQSSDFLDFLCQLSEVFLMGVHNMLNTMTKFGLLMGFSPTFVFYGVPFLLCLMRFTNWHVVNLIIFSVYYIIGTLLGGNPWIRVVLFFYSLSSISWELFMVANRWKKWVTLQREIMVIDVGANPQKYNQLSIALTNLVKTKMDYVPFILLLTTVLPFYLALPLLVVLPLYYTKPIIYYYDALKTIPGFIRGEGVGLGYALESLESKKKAKTKKIGYEVPEDIDFDEYFSQLQNDQERWADEIERLEQEELPKGIDWIERFDSLKITLDKSQEKLESLTSKPVTKQNPLESKLDLVLSRLDKLESLNSAVNICPEPPRNPETVLRKGKEKEYEFDNLESFHINHPKVPVDIAARQIEIKVGVDIIGYGLPSPVGITVPLHVMASAKEAAGKQDVPIYFVQGKRKVLLPAEARAQTIDGPLDKLLVFKRVWPFDQVTKRQVSGEKPTYVGIHTKNNTSTSPCTVSDDIVTYEATTVNGDSGAFVLNTQGKVVGLHLAKGNMAVRLSDDLISMLFPGVGTATPKNAEASYPRKRRAPRKVGKPSTSGSST